MAENGTDSRPAPAPAGAYPRHWRRPPAIQSALARRLLAAGLVGYLVFAFLNIEIDVPRLLQGLPRGLDFLRAFVWPDFTSRGGDIFRGVMESLAMTLVATVIGALLSLPLALGAAGNFAPRPVYHACRAIIALGRTFPEVMIAIFFVVMFGFGPLAGVITLVVATIGFLGKLIAEDIEACSMAPIEAMRATGATLPQILVYGLVPQILPRILGLSLYRLDINFRESAIIGVVGAGGIGATLSTTFDRYEFSSAAAILVVIIVIVLLTEHASGIVRRRLL
ncbi:MAG: phosphonate ABC transporter, permease protein PhnE [Puniceicoccaceae bacterium]|nr:MAG: phosphonate ABC transporter, permease protein PhnE [Puniceicoccaceae bacterium]